MIFFKKVDVETIAAMNLVAGTDIEYEEKGRGD